MELEGFAPVTVRNRAAGLKDRAIAGPHDYVQIPALVDRGIARLRDFYADLEARLGEQPFVAGSAFSAADITAFVTTDFATNALQLGIPDAGVAIQRWYDALAARETFDAAYAAAMAAGATDNGAPGARFHYDPRYCAGSVFDPDGYSLEFTYKSWQH